MKTATLHYENAPMAILSEFERMTNKQVLRVIARFYPKCIKANIGGREYIPTGCGWTYTGWAKNKLKITSK